MKIAFNATALLAPWAGVGQYTRNLAAELLKCDGLDLDFFCGLGWSRQIRATALKSGGRVLPLARRFIPFSYHARRFLQNLYFDRHASAGGFDLYHEPNFLPLSFAGPTVVTVHDLSWIRYPQTHPVERVRALNRHFQRGLEKASLVLTDSEFVRAELASEFGLPPARIRAIALAASDAFVPMSESETASALARFGLTHQRYFLSVGTLEPRKNVRTVLLAYERLPERLRDQYPLVLAGGSGWKSDALARKLDALVAKGQVRRLGYLTLADLAVVTAGACALVYPSLYEGFGLPPLEAMSCGVAPIVSNVSSLPEVVGDAGLLVDPGDVPALSEAMRCLAEDERRRAELGARSLQRSGRFSWARCAGHTVDAYRYAVSKS